MATSLTADAAAYAAFSLPIKIALIGVLGIGAQWLAWRLQRPAIVLMAVAGLIFGPLLGAILEMGIPERMAQIIGFFRLDPVNDFGDLYRPLVGLSVAIILFEGGLNLRIRDLGDARRAVLRMVLFGGPIAWVLGAIAAYYIVGLSPLIAMMVGGLFVVTGPTVIMPLLRQAHLKQRPANVLKWEGIVNDPVGALFAVIGYEIIVFQLTGVSATAIFGRLAFAAVFGIVLGIGSAYLLASAFRRGLIPEYLKAPVVLAWVLAVYVLSNKLADETGLLTVTALGMTMANLKFAAQVEMRRFKETITIILVSGIFVILTATLTPAILKAFLLEWRVWAFVAVMMILVRPTAVMLSTLWSGIDWRESLLISLIAPRGIVAVAVAGLFAAELQALGLDQGALFVPLAFALVFATVSFAGFAIAPLAKLLGQSSGGGEGVLIVGANPWSLGLAKALRDMDIGVIIADTNWRRLRAAKLDGHNTFFGEVLSENADYSLDHSQFNYLIAATANDAYNALVSVEFAPELGRHRVFQVSNTAEDAEDDAIAYTSRGRTLTSRGRAFDALTRDWWNGWRFRVTKLSDEYTLEDMYRDRGDTMDLILAKRADGSLDFIQPGQEDRARGHTVLSFCPVKDQDGVRGEGAKRSGGMTLAGPTAKLPN
jgi:NhaP-type Na+/H+ or K+/H+ antiporter